MHKPFVISEIRKEYKRQALNRSGLKNDPFEQFSLWFSEAINAEILEPNAMTLATASITGKPSSRIVLLKEVDALGFIFYTNFQSRKGKELEENPYASLTFLWKELERQVCIEGVSEKVSDEKALAYFRSRPRESQIGAWVSHQGEVLESREVLERAFENMKIEYEGHEIPLPPFWGGYRVIPEKFFFWQGRENRLHDRFMYTKETNGEWNIIRLAP